MVHLVIDAMDDASAWSAFEPDGATPSTEINIIDDHEQYYMGADQVSGQISVSTMAIGHSLRRSLPNIDLSDYKEIRFWLHGLRKTDGSIGHPFLLRIRFASASMDLSHVDNTWHRYLPVFSENKWEIVRLDITDLHPDIRNATNTMEISCIDAPTEFNCNIESVLAVREEMISDVDQALIETLNEKVEIDGDLVPAVIHHPEKPTNTKMPYILITQYDIRSAEERTSHARIKSNFSENTYKLQPVSNRYDLYYEIDAFADTRNGKTKILEFILSELSPNGYISANGVKLPVRMIVVDSEDFIGGSRSDRLLLHFKVETRREYGNYEIVTPPYHEVDVAVGAIAG